MFLPIALPGVPDHLQRLSFTKVSVPPSFTINNPPHVFKKNPVFINSWFRFSERDMIRRCFYTYPQPFHIYRLCNIVIRPLIKRLFISELWSFAVIIIMYVYLFLINFRSLHTGKSSSWHYPVCNDNTDSLFLYFQAIKPSLAVRLFVPIFKGI
jgi:hypothetical protein